MRHITVVAVGLLLCGAATSAAAQGTAVEGGVSLVGGASAFQIGIRGTTAKPGGLGVDFAIATYPDVLANGAFAALSDLALEYRAPLGDAATASIRAGGSALLASADGLTASAGGLNAGGGVIIRLGQKAGLRMDYTYRLFFTGGQTASLSSLTFGIHFGH